MPALRAAPAPDRRRRGDDVLPDLPAPVLRRPRSGNDQHLADVDHVAGQAVRAAWMACDGRPEADARSRSGCRPPARCRSSGRARASARPASRVGAGVGSADADVDGCGVGSGRRSALGDGRRAGRRGRGRAAGCRSASTAEAAADGGRRPSHATSATPPRPASGARLMRVGGGLGQAAPCRRGLGVEHQARAKATSRRHAREVRWRLRATCRASRRDSARSARAPRSGTAAPGASGRAARAGVRAWQRCSGSNPSATVRPSSARARYGQIRSTWRG